MKVQRLPVLLLLIGLVLLTTAVVVGWIIIPNAIHQQIIDTVQLHNESGTWEKWVNITTPIFIKFYIFNVTNPDEVVAGKIPRLQEVGPYVYQQKHDKFDISIDDLTDTVKYKQRTSYFFRPELSTGSDQDVVQVMNIPLVGIAKKLAYLPRPATWIANMYLTRFDQNLFFKNTVEEFLFKGKFHPLVDGLQNTFGLSILPNSTFGLYYGKNCTQDAEYEIKTGRSSWQEFGQIVTWNSQSSLDYWPEKYCNMINGSDGSLFPPFVQKDRILEIFTADLCRSLYLTYQKNVDFHGIPAYKFVIPKRMLEDPRINEDNKCFCPFPGRNMEGCLRAGAIQLSTCRKGAPIVASTPHFLDGYEGYVEGAIGLHPQRSTHETYIELEPTSGAVLRVDKRIQINVQLQPIPSLDIFRNVPEMLFPILWINEGAQMPDESIELLKQKLVTPVHVIGIGRLVFLAVSLIILACGVTVYVVQIRRTTQTPVPASIPIATLAPTSTADTIISKI